jgi:hypothetical protein
MKVRIPPVDDILGTLLIALLVLTLVGVLAVVVLLWQWAT